MSIRPEAYSMLPAVVPKKRVNPNFGKNNPYLTKEANE